MDKKCESREIITLMKEIVKKALEAMMLEERREYLEEHEIRYTLTRGGICDRTKESLSSQTSMRKS